MDGRINVAEAPEIMVSPRPPNPVEKANPAWMPRPNSPLEITPHKARVIRDGAMATAGTAIQVPTERRRAAALDGAQHFQLLPRQPGAVALDEVLAVLSDDIGHLEGGPIHFFCNFRDR